MMMRSEVGMGTGGGGGGTQFSDIFPPNNNNGSGGGNYSSMMTNNNNHNQMSGGNGNFSRMGSLDGPSMMYGMTGMGSMQYCMPIDAQQGKKTSSSNKMTMNSSQTQV
jgi:hypothetical protein